MKYKIRNNIIETYSSLGIPEEDNKIYFKNKKGKE